MRMDVTTTIFVGRIAGEIERNGRHSPFLPRDVLGIPTVFVWNLLFILVIALIFYWLLRSSRQSHETPLDLLKKRYVRGEIDKDEYEERKRVISD